MISILFQVFYIKKLKKHGRYDKIKKEYKIDGAQYGKRSKLGD